MRHMPSFFVHTPRRFAAALRRCFARRYAEPRSLMFLRPSALRVMFVDNYHQAIMF